MSKRKGLAESGAYYIESDKAGVRHHVNLHPKWEAFVSLAISRTGVTRAKMLRDALVMHPSLGKAEAMRVHVVNQIISNNGGDNE